MNKSRISLKCRVLGVHPTDDLLEIKKSRDRLLKIYHPDKHPNATLEERVILTEKFKKTQFAYEYIEEHYQEIQKIFSHLKSGSLTYRGNNNYKAHNVYTEISRSLE